MPDAKTSLSELLSKRLELLDPGQWEHLDDLQCDRAYARLHDMQEAILSSDLSGSESRLSALTVLLEPSDSSGFADDFKNRLFNALRLNSLSE